MQPESLITISGVSGSGKSTVLDALEDLGFYCIDNLPSALFDDFVDYLRDIPETEIGAEENTVLRERYQNFALLINCYERASMPVILEAMEKLARSGVEIRHLFLDCRDDVVLRRYQQTRRAHPLLGNYPGKRTILEALQEERELLAELRGLASRVLDTTELSPHELRRVVADYIGEQFELEVTIVSFGYKYGLPIDADLVIDVRFLPNPHFDYELQPRTGLDEAVRDYVFQGTEAEELMKRYVDLLRFLLPRYRAEGKRYLTVAIGCTGGRHRSVAVAEELATNLRDMDLRMIVRHRDADR